MGTKKYDLVAGLLKDALEHGAAPNVETNGGTVGRSPSVSDAVFSNVYIAAGTSSEDNDDAAAGRGVNFLMNFRAAANGAQPKGPDHTQREIIILDETPLE